MPSFLTSCSLPGFPGHHVICSPEAGMSPGRGLALNVLAVAGRLPRLEPTRRQGTLNHWLQDSSRGASFFLLAEFFSAQELIERELGTEGPGFESQVCPCGSVTLCKYPHQPGRGTERMHRPPSSPWEPRGPRVGRERDSTSGLGVPRVPH